MALVVDHAAMVNAFGDEMFILDARELPPGLTDPVARKVLTEVGLPNEILDLIFFEGAYGNVPTVLEFDAAITDDPVLADQFVLANAEYSLICLDGKTGECIFVEKEDKPQRVTASARLDLFADTIRRLYLGLNEADLDSHEAADEFENSLIDHLRSTEPAFTSESERLWRLEIEKCIDLVR